MRVQLFGVGTDSYSWAISAQRRINCYAEIRKEQERTSYALIGRPGLSAFVSDLGSNPTRGMWAVNTLSTPLLFIVQGDTLYSVDSAGSPAVIGTIATSSGNISMTDDGTNLMLVDGSFGYYYNMIVPAGLNTIVAGNFTTIPKTVAWQDTYFIVTSGTATKQFQLSANADPSTWPAVNINFAGSQGGVLQAGIADHNILNLFGDVYTEFWQDTGSPDFPYAKIPGSAQEFGLAAPFSLAKYDNSLVGLFQDKSGNINISRTSGFSLKRISDSDIEHLLSNMIVADAEGFAVTTQGHPLYVINFPSEQRTLVFDALSGVSTEMQSPSGGLFWGRKFANFQGKLLVSDYRNGNIYELNHLNFTDNESPMPMEVISQHIWRDNKYLGINQIQIDIESGVGIATGQGEDPALDLQLSKDGGNTFRSVGYRSMGKIGEYTHRAIWNSLGAARDMVIKLRITDPVKRVLVGASAEIVEARF